MMLLRRLVKQMHYFDCGHSYSPTTPTTHSHLVPVTDVLRRWVCQSIVGLSFIINIECSIVCTLTIVVIFQLPGSPVYSEEALSLSQLFFQALSTRPSLQICKHY